MGSHIYEQASIDKESHGLCISNQFDSLYV